MTPRSDPTGSSRVNHTVGMAAWSEDQRRTTLASLDDVIRTTAAHAGKKASEQLPRLRRLLDLAQTVGPDPDRFALSDPRLPSSA